MTDTRNTSKERNAARPTIGNAKPAIIDTGSTPGPSNYYNIRQTMGDASSVKIVFPTAERPISARAGHINRI